MPARPPIGHNQGPSLPPLHHRWYGLKRWKVMRARQLEREPFCRMCKAQGMTRPAKVADHITPHRGSPALFWRGKLQSLCVPCHNRHKQREELDGFSDEIGADGWPVDPAHPINLEPRGRKPERRPKRPENGRFRR